MNQIVKHEDYSAAEHMDRAELIRVLQSSLYPDAKPESIELVLAYCRANRLDVMLKPVHIVPTSVKKPDGSYHTIDVLMPGIADYRIKAARSGEYGGKSEPEFGPDITQRLGGIEVTYPAWCRITVRRIVQGQARDFPAREQWLENYATAKRDSQAPNRMWLKRPYGQLAKCCEAQALRMAFPEFSAGYTAEEMEGRADAFEGTTIDAEPQRGGMREVAASVQSPPRKAEPAATNGNGHPATRTKEQWDTFLTKLRAALSVVHTRADVVEIGGKSTVGDALAGGPEWVTREISAALAEAYGRFPDEPEADADVAGEPELPEVAVAGERYAAG